MKVKSFSFFSLTLFFCIISTLSLFSEEVWTGNYTKSGIHEGDLIISNGSLACTDNVTINGNLQITNGSIAIPAKLFINGDLIVSSTVKSTTPLIDIVDDMLVTGNITIKNNNGTASVLVGENVHAKDIKVVGKSDTTFQSENGSIRTDGSIILESQEGEAIIQAADTISTDDISISGHGDASIECAYIKSKNDILLKSTDGSTYIDTVPQGAIRGFFFNPSDLSIVANNIIMQGKQDAKINSISGVDAGQVSMKTEIGERTLEASNNIARFQLGKEGIVPQDALRNAYGMCTADLTLNHTLDIHETCTIDGNNHEFKLLTGGNIKINSGDTLTFKDITIRGIGGTDIQCADNSATIYLNNVKWIQDEDYTFANGVMQFINNVWFDSTAEGSSKNFTYASNATSTVRANSLVEFDAEINLVNGTAFSLDTLLDYENPSARLFFYKDGLRTSFRETYTNRIIPFNDDGALYFPMDVYGSCTLQGNHNRVNMEPGAEIVIHAGSNLTLNDIYLTKLQGTNIRCEDNTGTLYLHHSKIALMDDYTYAKGTIQTTDRNIVQEFEKVKGRVIKFSYDSPLTATIRSNSSWEFGRAIDLNTTGTLPLNELILLESEENSRILFYKDGLRTSFNETFTDNIISYESDGIISSQMDIYGSTTIAGNHYRVSMDPMAEIIIHPGASLTLNDVYLTKLHGTNIRCVDNTGTLYLHHAKIAMDDDFTFANGSIKTTSRNLIQEYEKIQGRKLYFNYNTNMTSTVGFNSSFELGRAIDFNPNPLSVDDAIYLASPGDSRFLYFKDGIRTALTETYTNNIISYESDGIISNQMDIYGSTTIAGNHYRVSMEPAAEIVIHPGASLTLNDVYLTKLHGSNIRCVDNTGVLYLHHAKIAMDDDFTFANGSIKTTSRNLIQEYEKIQGRKLYFNYNTNMTSTVGFNSSFELGRAIDFNPNPLSVDDAIYLASPGDSRFLYFKDGIRTALTETYTNNIISYESDGIISNQMDIYGSTTIAGNHYRVSMEDNAEIVIHPGAALTLNDVYLTKLHGTNIRCVDNTGTLYLHHAKIAMDDDFTFANGSIKTTSRNLIQEYEKIQGRKLYFNYNTNMTSTVGFNSSFELGRAIDFNPNPLSVDDAIFLESPGDSRFLYFKDGIRTALTETYTNNIISYESDGIISNQMDIYGSTTIAGNHYRVSMEDNAEIVIHPGAALTLNDVYLTKLHGSNIRCVDNTGVLYLHHAKIAMDDDFTFAKGSIKTTSRNLIQEYEKIQGRKLYFNYNTNMTSTVGFNSSFELGRAIDFNPNPLSVDDAIYLASPGDSRFLYFKDGIRTALTETYTNNIISYESDGIISNQMDIYGSTTIAGNHYRVSMEDNAEIVIHPGAALTLNDVYLTKLHGSNIRCVDNTGVLYLHHAKIAMDDDFTFANGSIKATSRNLIQEYEKIQGRKLYFNYNTNMTSTVGFNSSFELGRAIDFNPNPLSVDDAIFLESPGDSRFLYFKDGIRTALTETYSDNIISYESDGIISNRMDIYGSTTIAGNHYRVSMDPTAEIVIHPGASLTLNDVYLAKLQGTNIRCVDNTGVLHLHHAKISIIDDFTFANGSIKTTSRNLIQEYEKVRSKHVSFNYDTSMTSTIGINSSFELSRNIQFNSSILTVDQAIHLESLGNSRFSYYKNGIQTALAEEYTNNIISFHSDGIITEPMDIYGSSTLVGNNGRVEIEGNGAIIIHSGADFTLNNLTLSGIAGTNVRCVDDTATLYLKNVTWEQSGDFAFNNGELNITGNCEFFGFTKTFTYASLQQSYINQNSILSIDYGMNFAYTPIHEDRIILNNPTSIFMFNGGKLHIINDLRLTRGTMFFDNSVTTSIDPGKILYFGNSALGADYDLGAEFLAGATLNTYGNLKIDNVNP